MLLNHCSVTVANFVNGNNGGIPGMSHAWTVQALSPPEGGDPPSRTRIPGVDRMTSGP